MEIGGLEAGVGASDHTPAVPGHVRSRDRNQPSHLTARPRSRR